jgi:hypothetical protein
MIMRCELPRNTGADGDGVAQTETDHFEKCPVCSRWFDMRDLAQVADHIHDGSEIDVLEGPGPPPREGPVQPIRCNRFGS